MSIMEAILELEIKADKHRALGDTYEALGNVEKATQEVLQAIAYREAVILLLDVKEGK